jgi:hypothetical protein
MSIGSISDALSQISTIEAQLQQLQSGALLDSVLGVSSDTAATTDSNSSSTAASSGSASSTDFADALAQAQTATTGTSGSDTAASDGAGTLASLASTAALSAGTASTANTASTAATSTYNTSGATLPASASTLLTSGQQQFASALSADTGLNPGVVTAWMLSEESGTAAQSRQVAGNNDWLNIGYTDSGAYGASDSVWSDPTTAATATAQWLQGQNSISGYGGASSGVQSILSSVGQTPQAQITAIQSSGWASSGYPDLTNVYDQVTGTTAT